MRFDDDNEGNDYFDGPDLPDAPEKKEKEEVKLPDLNPEDPDYWDRPESEWEHLKPQRKTRFIMIAIAAALALFIVIGIWIYWFSPYVKEATQYGYVESIEKRGVLFDTFEGVLLPYKELKDTTRVYRGDFKFSVPDPKMAVQLKRMQYSNRPVRVEYSRYHGTLPWRGDEKIVITRVDSVDPRDILPPEFQPEVL